MATKWSKTQVRDELLKQLSLKNADLAPFNSFIKDYMTLWDTKEGLAKDIKNRGVTYKEEASGGRMVWRSNPSVKELVNVNRQMLSILKELGLSTANIADGDEDEL